MPFTYEAINANKCKQGGNLKFFVNFPPKPNICTLEILRPAERLPFWQMVY